MDKNKVKIGMKVVPHSKSYCICHDNSFRMPSLSLDNCAQWRKAKAEGIPYLYVVHQHASDAKDNTGVYLLSTVKDIPAGSYYKADDFEPYMG